MDRSARPGWTGIEISPSSTPVHFPSSSAVQFRTVAYAAPSAGLSHGTSETSFESGGGQVLHPICLVVFFALAALDAAQYVSNLGELAQSA
jgi:hypothetical protein